MTKVTETKSQAKKQTKCASIRISRETQRKLDRVLGVANKKTIGRKIRAENILSLAVELIAEDHIKLLQEGSMTNEDRKEQLRQKYIELRGQISKDEFTGFMLTSEFQEFLSAHAAQGNSGALGSLAVSQAG